jgi:hypothetical protein
MKTDPQIFQKNPDPVIPEIFLGMVGQGKI